MVKPYKLDDKMERYTIILQHENFINGIKTVIEEPIACHLYLNPLFEKRDYSNSYIITQLVTELRKILYAEEVLL